MIEKFVEEYVKLISADSEKVRVERVDISESFSELTVYASSSDTGKIIGKDGKMINAIKTLISGCKAKDGRTYKVVVATV